MVRWTAVDAGLFSVTISGDDRPFDVTQVVLRADVIGLDYPIPVAMVRRDADRSGSRGAARKS